MPKENGEAETTVETPAAPVVDAFGQGETAAPVVEDTKVEKKFESIPEDHPTIVALKGQIEAVKKEYGTNLSGQRTVIATLEGKIDALTKGGAVKADEGGDADVLFKDIKRSKDLTKEQREEMTDTEIRQMDEIADMKDAQNRLYAQQQKGTKTEEATKVENLNGLVQTFAKDLAKGADGKENIDLANQIIESVKQFALDGLSAEVVKERVLSAYKLLPSYTPPKEQTHRTGRPVKEAPSAADPFGVDKIVEEARSGSNGDYSL